MMTLLLACKLEDDKIVSNILKHAFICDTSQEASAINIVQYLIQAFRQNPTNENKKLVALTLKTLVSMIEKPHSAIVIENFQSIVVNKVLPVILSNDDDDEEEYEDEEYEDEEYEDEDYEDDDDKDDNKDDNNNNNDNVITSR